ncbi:unnamed protein product [Dracunculus medinensis]|uniref:protein O-GlcNAcase n=1 Tax=Dracunculus medinensis TaxID=318479 RepID=A0A158Q3M9_DRAME|nr:unnamed protein product [Dracunculus medinensis]
MENFKSFEKMKRLFIYQLSAKKPIVHGFYGRPWANDQRQELFRWMQKFGMNTYLYAPKDDIKHRYDWRKLYTTEELDLLQSLINAAKEYKITFVYSLSPGLDITYSSDKEVQAIKDKFDQVKSIGCEAFALLFDDVDAIMHEVDKSKFSSFAMAQVTVTNLIYEYLKCPVFYFCPTEYCESRAFPSLQESEYLSFLGKKLLPDIYIFWTGPRVVSRSITIEHMRSVADILKRKPVIWDNLHASDYDAKRIHLGPFTGRSVKLKDEIAGLLMNPNCRLEANFVPLHTVAEWNLCEDDAELDGAFDSDAILEAGDIAVVAAYIVEGDKSKRLYHPLNALNEALKKWYERLFTEVEITPSCQMETEALTSIVEKPPFLDSNTGRPLYKNLGNMLTQSSSDPQMKPTICAMNSLSPDYSEPMDLITLAKDEPKILVDSDSSNKMNNQDMVDTSSDVSMESSITTDSGGSVQPEHLAMFVDLYYLPFEHGRSCIQILEEFTWLHENSFVIKKKKEASENKNVQTIINEDWKRRCDSLLRLLHNLTKFYQLLTALPNKAAVQDLFQYVYEIQGIASMLEVILLWMADGGLTSAPRDSDYFWRKPMIDGEPWIVSGGSVSDLLKLLFVTPNIMDLITLKSVIPLFLNCLTMRPYRDKDEKEIYSLYAQDDSLSTNFDFSNDCKSEQSFDSQIVPFLSHSEPRISFVAVENSSYGKRITAFSCAVLKAKEFSKNVQNAYTSKTQLNYEASPEMEENDCIEGSKLQSEEIDSCVSLQLSDQFYEHFPSQVEIRWRSTNHDAVAVRRLICASAAALSFNGLIFLILIILF